MASRLRLRHLRQLCTATVSRSAETVVTPFAAFLSSPLSVTQAQSKLLNEFDANNAKILKIYFSLDPCPLYTCTSNTEVAAVRQLAKSRRFNDIEFLLESQKKEPTIKQEPYVAHIIQSYNVAGMLDNAIATFHQVDQLGTPRSSLSFNALLSARVQSRQFNKVEQLWDEIPKRYQVSPDEMSFGILVKSYCEAGDPKKGVELVREMERMKMEVDRYVYTPVLQGFYKKGMVQEAEKPWDEMVRKRCYFGCSCV